MGLGMRFVSTRGGAPPVDAEGALSAGLAPDGGLYVPETLPVLAPEEWRRLERLAVEGTASSRARFAAALLAPFFGQTSLAADLERLCRQAFSFALPLAGARGGAWDLGPDLDPTLELFHGPTAAFKDVGARFLAGALERLEAQPAAAERGVLQVLVATSGDTGAAVADAFHGRAGLAVAVLYPRGRVSTLQARHLDSFGGNVRSFAVPGTFDDCQAAVKAVLARPGPALRVTSANSIGLGRLLPQVVPFALAACRARAGGSPPLGFVVPTGNLGNGLACLWARALGAPIGTVALATNANDVLPRALAGEGYAPRPALPTLANAMDVGDPSNFERLAWARRDAPAVGDGLPCESFDDAAIGRELEQTWRERGVLLCPHTATASALRRRLRAAGEGGPLAIVATAHPAKFEEALRPHVERRPELPANLAAALARGDHGERLDLRADESLADALRLALLR